MTKPSGSLLSDAAAKAWAAAVSLVILVAAVVGIIAIRGIGKWFILQGVAALALAYGAYHFGRFRSPAGTHPAIDTDLQGTRVARVFPSQGDAEFRRVISDLVARSAHMAFIGLGLAVLADYQFDNDLFERACAPGVQVKICFANPYGKTVVTRIADEHVKLLAQPEIGPLGLRRRVSTLLDSIARFQRQGRSPNIEISFFDQYPTCSVLMFDQTVFAFLYGHSMTGHVSPVLELHGTSGLAAYFRRNADDILNAAVPASEIITCQRKPGVRKTNWRPAGVYFVPDRESQLYAVMSELLGWDIWAGQPVRLREEYQRLIPDPGAARYYGAHITIADAMYFAADEPVEHLARELELLAELCPSFNARIGELITGHRGPGGLAIDVDDLEGGFELLHQELLDSTYRRAITSVLLSQINDEQLRAHSTRDRRAISQFGSPYVMSRYKPHFTLSRNLPGDGPGRTALLEAAESMFRSVRREFRVDRIVLARRRADSSYWTIADGDVFTLRGDQPG